MLQAFITVGHLKVFSAFTPAPEVHQRWYFLWSALW